MGRSRLVKPDAQRIDISDGDWIVVKKRLTAGEQHKIFSDLVKTMNAGDAKVAIDPELVGFTKAAVYLVDWSQEDNPIRGAGTEDIIKALQAIDNESWKEISAAIDAHEAKMDGERSVAKNDQGTTNGSAATSPSLV